MIDDSIDFIPLAIAIVTVSDTRTDEDDRSGALLRERAESSGHRVVDKRIVPDDREGLEALLRELVADPNVQVVISTGGTGVTGRDITPEAMEAVVDKPIPGFGELFRWLSYRAIGTSAIQSRATAGVAGGTYLFALPGSPGAVKDAWDQILVFQLDARFRPCNFAELIGRLQE